MGGYSLPKEERIRQRADFLYAYQKGECRKTQHFRIYLSPNRLPHQRLGITVAKRIGNAVKRNRLKRLLREFFRLNKGLFPGFTDIVISGQTGAADLTYWQLAEELKGILEKR